MRLWHSDHCRAKGVLHSDRPHIVVEQEQEETTVANQSFESASADFTFIQSPYTVKRRIVQLIMLKILIII
jgi:hypothetical protein